MDSDVSDDTLDWHSAYWFFKKNGLLLGVFRDSDDSFNVYEEDITSDHLRYPAFKAKQPFKQSYLENLVALHKLGVKV